MCAAYWAATRRGGKARQGVPYGSGKGGTPARRHTGCGDAQACGGLSEVVHLGKVAFGFGEGTLAQVGAAGYTNGSVARAAWLLTHKKGRCMTRISSERGTKRHGLWAPAVLTKWRSASTYVDTVHSMRREVLRARRSDPAKRQWSWPRRGGTYCSCTCPRI